MIELEIYQLKKICKDMAELGAANYAKLFMPGVDRISQRCAYRGYGEARVKRWVKANLVSKHRSGKTIRSKIIYSKAELMAADKAESINQYINR